MSPTLLLLGAAKALVKNRKLQLALVGVQFAFIVVKMIGEKNSKKKIKKKDSKKKQPIKLLTA